MKVKVDVESFRSYGVFPEVDTEYEIESLHGLIEILKKLQTKPVKVPPEFIGFHLPVIDYDEENNSINLVSWLEM
jgi:hypothetical protein